MDPAPPRLTFAMELRVEVDPALEIGTVPRGRRRIVGWLTRCSSAPASAIRIS